MSEEKESVAIDKNLGIALVPIDKNLAIALIRFIDTASQRGAITGEELGTVGAMRTMLQEALKDG